VQVTLRVTRRKKRDSPVFKYNNPVNDLGKQFAAELEEFFVDYHKLSGERYKVLGLKGPNRARKSVKSTML
jgi:inorganic pyrophosphatase